MNRYVVTFLFTPGFTSVWMIEKLKPVWQNGCLNGIGGKIEPTEQPIEAAIRELKEHRLIENVPFLIEGCLYLLTGHSQFQFAELKY